MVFANEYVNAARDTYKANFPDTILVDTDIREIRGHDVLKIIGKQRGELDLLDGSPPCSSFSTTGVRNKNWGQVKHYSDEKWQRTDDLYFEFIRLLSEIKPKVFLTENVPALTQGYAKGYFNKIFSAMREAGYNVKSAILNALDYGVAQNRKRLFTMGVVRGDQNPFPSFPIPIHPKKKLTVREVWYNPENPIANTKEEIAEASIMPRFAKMWIQKVEAGKRGMTVHPSKSALFSLQRLAMNKPSPTVCKISSHAAINHRYSGICHPTENRYLTIRELKRISSFPDDFILTGNFPQQWERIARAVPPRLMQAIASHIGKTILPNLTNQN